MLLLFLLLVSLVRGSYTHGQNPSNPGVKFGFPKATLDYMVTQIFPWLESQLTDITIPDIKEDKIYTPIGPVYFWVENSTLTNFKIDTPSFDIKSSDKMKITIQNLYIKGGADWRYEEKSWPHIKDHGTLDLKNVLVTVKIEFKVDIDSSEKSNIKISSSDFDLDWQTFDISVHGGAHATSWIYDAIIDNFKGTLEGYISDSLKDVIPDDLINLLQPMINDIPFTYVIPNPHDLELTYLPTEIKLDKDNQYISVGAIGAMEHDNIVPPGNPIDMPDISGTKMLQAFFSEWTFQTASYSANQAGILIYLVKNSKDFPLNTKDFEYFIPKLEQMFPDKDMQCNLSTSPGTIPTFDFSDSSGYRLTGDMNADFQVINSTTEIVSAFTLRVDMTLNFTVSLKQGKKTYEYDVTGKLGLNALNVSLVSSIVGNFNTSILTNMVTQMVDKFAIPNLNMILGHGIPIPPSQYFQLKDPVLQLESGYFVAEFDFNFFTPKIRRPFFSKFR